MHLHPSVSGGAFRFCGERWVLISDFGRGTGMANGQYTLGGQPIGFQDGKATLLDGTLAGS